MIFENKDKVLGSECDTNANLSVLGTFNKIQDNVCMFFGSLNIHQIELKTKHNSIWLYTKNTVKFLLPLAWNEEFTIKCFFSSITPAKMIVDTVFINKNNEIAVYSKIEAALYDIGTQRLKRTTELGISNEICEKSLMGYDVVKINNYEKLLQCDEVKVKLTNLDYSIHTNNVEYIRFILNSYKLNDLSNKTIKEISINYINQSFEGQILNIYKETADNTDTFTIKCNDSNIIKANITFNL